MKLRLFTVVPLFLLASVAVVAQDNPKCSSTAQECEREIRQMLSGRRYLGVQISDLNPGIIIKAINDDGPAAQADLESGDRIIAVNGRSMRYASIQDFKNIIADVQDKGGVLFITVQRKTSFRRAQVRLQPYPKAQIDKIVAAHLAQSHGIVAGQ